MLKFSISISFIFCFILSVYSQTLNNDSSLVSINNKKDSVSSTKQPLLTENLQATISQKDSIPSGNSLLLGHIYNEIGSENHPGGFTIQISSLHSLEHAKEYTLHLRQKGYNPVYIEVAEINDHITYRILIGNFATRIMADYALHEYKQKGLNGFVKHHSAF